MRMSGFVVGGLLGAAAAMYFNRGNRSFNLGTLSSAGQALDKWVDTARSRMMDPDRRSYGTTNHNSTTGTGGIERVESIVKEDPQLSKQVNEILSENTTGATIR